jgi:TRAP-type mannitol/chloroaromatic compound transport system permease small subunit
MIRLIRLIDRISTFVGQTFAWLIVVLALHVCWEVAARYLLNRPSAWAFDMQMMYYGILFMMAGAYTLAKNGHVRGDICTAFCRRGYRPGWTWFFSSCSFSRA